jgi:hypothetical protein
MRKKIWTGVTFAAALLILGAVVAAALRTPSGAGGAAAPPQASGSLGREALAFLYSPARSRTHGIPLPMAREKLARGREASREIMRGAAQEAYADLAYPHKTIAVAQQQAAVAAMRRHDDDDDDDNGGGGRRPRWEEVGPFTLEIAREATQNNGLTTEWSGRMTAIAVDPKCDRDDCRVYVGAAGGGVWRTDDALSPTRAGSRSTEASTRPRSAHS